MANVFDEICRWIIDVKISVFVSKKSKSEKNFQFILVNNFLKIKPKNFWAFQFQKEILCKMLSLVTVSKNFCKRLPIVAMTVEQIKNLLKCNNGEEILTDS